jgi:hypothetical protein
MLHLCFEFDSRRDHQVRLLLGYSYGGPQACVKRQVVGLDPSLKITPPSAMREVTTRGLSFVITP